MIIEMRNRLLGGALLLGLTANGVVLARGSTPDALRDAARPPATLQEATPLDSSSSAWGARALFRRNRIAPSVRYRSTPPDLAVQSQPATPRPRLTLRGIVVGAETAAVLEGLPGVEGTRVVRRGETIGELTVRRIEKERVIVSGMDTSWTLTLPRGGS